MIFKHLVQRRVFWAPLPMPMVVSSSLHLEHKALQSLARAAAADVRMLIVPVDIATEFPASGQIPVLLLHG